MPKIYVCRRQTIRTKRKGALPRGPSDKFSHLERSGARGNSLRSNSPRASSGPFCDARPRDNREKIPSNTNGHTHQKSVGRATESPVFKRKRQNEQKPGFCRIYKPFLALKDSDKNYSSYFFNISL